MHACSHILTFNAPPIEQALSSADDVAPSPPSGVSLGYTGYAAAQQQVSSAELSFGNFSLGDLQPFGTNFAQPAPQQQQQSQQQQAYSASVQQQQQQVRGAG